MPATERVLTAAMIEAIKAYFPRYPTRQAVVLPAAHVVNDHLRSAYSHKEEPLGENLSLADSSHPEQTFEKSWRQQQVRDAVARLTPEQQHVLALRFGEDFSLEETANIMGKTVNAVKALQFRAVASLRRLIEERFRG